MLEHKAIHFNLYNPKKSIFKGSKNNKAEIQVIFCKNCDNCGLYKQGFCAIQAGLFGSNCPYGYKNRNEGFSSRAYKFSTWITEKQEKYKGVPFLKTPPQKIAQIGDYIYLPYNFMDMYDSKLFSYPNFLKNELFTEELIINLCNFRPRALWTGDEIKDYQQKVIPLFLIHLKEYNINLYNNIIKNDYISTKVKNLTNVGRKAKLFSLIQSNIPFKDIHGGLWIWDGEYLTSQNSKASFMLVDKFTEIRIKPLDNAEVIIQHDEQVNNNTIFID